MEPLIVTLRENNEKNSYSRRVSEFIQVAMILLHDASHTAKPIKKN